MAERYALKSVGHISRYTDEEAYQKAYEAIRNRRKVMTAGTCELCGGVIRGQTADLLPNPETGNEVDIMVCRTCFAAVKFLAQFDTQSRQKYMLLARKTSPHKPKEDLWARFPEEMAEYTGVANAAEDTKPMPTRQMIAEWVANREEKQKANAAWMRRIEFEQRPPLYDWCQTMEEYEDAVERGLQGPETEQPDKDL